MTGNYYKTKETVEEYIQLAKDVNGLKLIDKLRAFLPADSSVLEIGSGPGTDFQILKKYYRMTGSDYSQEFLSRLVSNNPTDEFLKLDAISLQTDNQFDGIYSNKVLQHLTDDELKKTISRQFDILQSDGVICHSFWKGEGSEEFKGLLVNYQTEDSLKTLFDNYFDVLLIEKYNEFDDGDSLLILAKKKENQL